MQAAMANVQDSDIISAAGASRKPQTNNGAHLDTLEYSE
jgi:hypothetical protein